jgi:signal transduction histidine kinase/ActR/RegA family two-component response regulator
LSTDRDIKAGLLAGDRSGASPPGGRALVRGTALAGAALGLFFLLGWIIAGPEAMAGIGYAIKTNTALCLVLCSAALVLASGAAPRAGAVSRGLAVVVMVIATMTLSQYLTGIDLHIDQLIARDFASTDRPIFPNRMAPVTAVALTFLATALLLIPSARNRRALLGQSLALAALVISLLALVGYLYDASVLYRPTHHGLMSPYTAAGAGLLALGALALRRDLGLPRLVVSPGSGGYLTRRLILLTTLTPILLGWLRLEGERLGWYSTSTGTSMLVILTVVTFGLLVVLLARSLERADVRRRQVEAELRHSATLTAALARAATVGEVVDVTMRLGLPALGASSGGIFLLSKDGRELRMMSSEGYSQSVVTEYAAFSVESQLPASEAVRAQWPVFVSTREEYTRRFPSVAADRVAANSSWAALPVQGRQRIIGVLGLSFREPQVFPEPQRERLVGLAWQCGQALDRALLSESEKGARESAEAANRAKDEFLAMLGHELRNPLSPISTALEMMKMRASDTHQKERAIIERQVGHMVRLVDDLLDVSRITQGKIELKRQRVQIAGIVAKAIEVSSPLYERRMHHLHTHVPAGLAVLGDEHRLTQVLANLLTNAAKYTEPGGRISLTAEAVDGQAVIRVKDTGVGIAADLLPRIFDLFVQGYRTPERSGGGLGLGLSIARRLVEMHGGRVQAVSEGPGSGSEFIVWLPLDASVAAGLAPAAAAGAAAPAARKDSRRVLVVDDNRDAAELLGEALAMEGHQVRVAFDGPNALDVAAHFRPELAFLDIGLPAMDGYDLARRMRALPLEPLTLVAVTGYGQPSDRARSMEAGFDEHLVKPLELDSALAIVDDPSLCRRSPARGVAG